MINDYDDKRLWNYGEDARLARECLRSAMSLHPPDIGGESQMAARSGRSLVQSCERRSRRFCLRLLRKPTQQMVALNFLSRHSTMHQPSLMPS